MAPRGGILTEIRVEEEAALDNDLAFKNNSFGVWTTARGCQHGTMGAVSLLLVSSFTLVILVALAACAGCNAAPVKAGMPRIVYKAIDRGFAALGWLGGPMPRDVTAEVCVWGLSPSDFSRAVHSPPIGLTADESTGNGHIWFTFYRSNWYLFGSAILNVSFDESSQNCKASIHPAGI
jgi:hypothetical protein